FSLDALVAAWCSSCVVTSSGITPQHKNIGFVMCTILWRYICTSYNGQCHIGHVFD
uniref:Uncharacterized protein n=1 Tax=Aegilops tauschii subsp. strangulata TaxID=200361 RepID=A0A453DWT5_AEGTS